MPSSPPLHPRFPLWLAVLAASFLGCARPVDAPVPENSQPHSAVHSAAHSADHPFPVVIRATRSPRPIATDRVDAQGATVALHCADCHRVRPANPKTAQSAELDEFHQRLRIAHGGLTCGSCHAAAEGYATLRLADGRSLSFEDSMTLCAQCHGTQYRDYQRGAHGGMTGYWDLSRGGRTRNHCLHCHDPHAPQYPTFTPAAGPRDRFPPQQAGESHE